MQQYTLKHPPSSRLRSPSAKSGGCPAVRQIAAAASPVAVPHVAVVPPLHLNAVTPPLHPVAPPPPRPLRPRRRASHAPRRRACTSTAETIATARDMFEGLWSRSASNRMDDYIAALHDASVDISGDSLGHAAQSGAGGSESSMSPNGRISGAQIGKGKGQEGGRKLRESNPLGYAGSSIGRGGWQLSLLRRAVVFSSALRCRLHLLCLAALVPAPPARRRRPVPCWPRASRRKFSPRCTWSHALRAAVVACFAGPAPRLSCPARPAPRGLAEARAHDGASLAGALAPRRRRSGRAPRSLPRRPLPRPCRAAAAAFARAAVTAADDSGPEAAAAALRDGAQATADTGHGAECPSGNPRPHRRERPRRLRNSTLPRSTHRAGRFDDTPPVVAIAEKRIRTEE
ncbi:hypothetical protein EJB05_54527, partial [Eragrostis curvula]